VTELYDAMLESQGMSLQVDIRDSPVTLGDKDLLAVALANLVADLAFGEDLFSSSGVLRSGRLSARCVIRRPSIRSAKPRLTVSTSGSSGMARDVALPNRRRYGPAHGRRRGRGRG